MNYSREAEFPMLCLWCAGRVKGTDRDSRGGLGDSLFQTASGKMVNISSKGLFKAKTLLGLEDDNDDCNLPGFNCGGVKDAVSVSRSSLIHMTGSVQITLTNESNLNSVPSEVPSAACTPSSIKLHTPGGRSTSVSTDARKTGSVQSRCKNESNQNFMHSEMTNSVCTPSSVQLHTPSGRSLSVLTDAHKTGSVQSRFKNEWKLNYMQSEMPNSDCTPSSAKLLASGGSSKSLSTGAHMAGSVQSGFKNEGDLSFMQSQKPNLAPKPPSIKFHTAGGRSISVSTDALQRARSLLGDPDLGTLLNEGNADLDLTFSEGREHDSQTASSHQKMPKTKVLTRSFVSPPQSSTNQVQSSAVKSDSTNWGTNLISQFDVVSNENACRSKCELPCGEKPFSNKPCTLTRAENNYLANGAGERINPVERSLTKPLVDISNTIGTTPQNNMQMAGVKRRLGGNSVSPFKKPRISNFSTPLHRNVPLVPNGKLYKS